MSSTNQSVPYNTPTVAIIGGGLSGLVAAILLSRKKISCILFERHEYPFHRVCGEYISNETRDFLTSQGLYPHSFAPPEIKRFQLSTRTGAQRVVPLDLGGFGISRYAFDDHLYKIALESGANIRTGIEVSNVAFREDKFEVLAGKEVFDASVVLGAFGKRSKLDVALNRPFIKKRSPFVGVKYHVQSDHPPDLIALHNFPGGYCGISRVENDITNLCYLVRRERVRQAGSIPSLEEKFLFQNPLLRSIFLSSTFLFDKPQTINEISFANKAPLHEHILITGDAAGMIAPLCGNGMAMAIHGGLLASQWIARFVNNEISRESMERGYAVQWRTSFSRRLWVGRSLQKIFENEWLSSALVNVVMHSSMLSTAIIRQSHGEPFGE